MTMQWLVPGLAAMLAGPAFAQTTQKGAIDRGAGVVLFVCEHGAAKSVVAAAHFNRLAQERRLPYRAVAKGVQAQEAVAPSAAQGLLADGLEVGALRLESVTTGDLRAAARVVSFGCDLSSLSPSGLAVERWDDVPAVSEGYEAARDAMVRRIGKLLDQLGRSR